MDSAPLAERIGPLLQKIPHKQFCATQFLTSRCSSCGQKFDNRDACDCDREAQIAAAVARAIEAAVTDALGYAANKRQMGYEAALRALADPQNEVPHG